MNAYIVILKSGASLKVHTPDNLDTQFDEDGGHGHDYYINPDDVAAILDSNADLRNETLWIAEMKEHLAQREVNNAKVKEAIVKKWDTYQKLTLEK